MEKKHIFLKVIIGCLLVVIVFEAYVGVSNYLDKRPKLQYTFNTVTSQSSVKYPDAQFAVISDLHYYNKALGITGSAFEEDLGADRKLLKESEDLLNLAIDNILKSKVKFVLVSGDLTKDGELINHINLTTALSRLTNNGISVYIVPGNHDVNNPRSFKYEQGKKVLIPNVSEEKFSDIYKNYGYNKAILKDKNSLSYVAEPVKDMWLVAVDSTRSEENKPGEEEIWSGNISQDQEKWLEDVLKKAKQNNKAVIYMEHHGVVEHWNGQGKLHPDYLIQDYQYIGKLLASYNVRLAFTGHYHAQDIALGDFGKDGFIYDIETGSLITAPCAIRYCELSQNKLKISSTNIVGELSKGTDFEAKAMAFIHKTVKTEAYEAARSYFVSKNDSDYIADYIASAFMAHYNGNENKTKIPEFDTSKLNLWGKFVYSQQKYVIDGLLNDTPPSDINVELDLDTK